MQISYSIVFLLQLNVGCSVFGIRNTEQPEFEVLQSEGEFEVRKYAPQLIAKTTLEGGLDESSNDGFRVIANYIFGENLSGESVSMTAPVVQVPPSQQIAMTTPVVQSPSESGWTMYFIMPSKYTIDTIPKPKNDKVIIEELPSETVAINRYSGFFSEKKHQKKSHELLQWINSKGYRVISKPRSARYDPPWTIPFFRRHESQIKIKFFP